MIKINEREYNILKEIYPAVTNYKHLNKRLKPSVAVDKKLSDFYLKEDRECQRYIDVLFDLDKDIFIAIGYNWQLYSGTWHLGCFQILSVWGKARMGDIEEQVKNKRLTSLEEDVEKIKSKLKIK